MISQDVLDIIYEGALLIQVLLLFPTFYRAVIGPTISDRLLAIDLITTLLIGIIVVLALMSENESLLDISIAIAALSFIATLAVTRYVSEGKVF